MTGRELIKILESDDGLWLDIPIVDSFSDEITEVLLKSEYVQLWSDSDVEMQETTAK